MKIPIVALLSFVAASVAAPAYAAAPSLRETPPKPIFADAAPVITLDELRKVSLPNTTIESVTIDPADGACRVTAIVTHPPAKDRVKVWIALPMKNWNGRFQGNGGGGFSGGSPDSLRAPAAQGFATGATDAGHEGGSGSFILHESGRLNWQEFRDFAYLGIHDMTVVGKALARAFYGKAPRYCYFVGSSTGGRQGLMEAQRFPEDYDGIISRCPAVNWQYLVAATMWPQAVMLEAKHFVPKAKFDAVTAAVVAACDATDGVVDGVIDDPIHCTWDPKAFVGTKVGDDTFTEADADIVRKIWDGPRGRDGTPLWYGLPRGASLLTVAATEGTPLTGKPYGPGLDRVRYLLAQNAKYDWTTLTRDQLELFTSQCVELYGPTIGSDNPDLTRFQKHGGKVIILHGMADQILPPQGTISYYERVQQYMGGPKKTGEFARLFLVPGVDHGFRGAGPSPTGLMTAILDWVEAGKAPDRLMSETRDKAGNVTRSRPLFPYPRFAKYSGHGSTDDSANFVSTTPAKP
jgi:pimeloyl-ACP methyl ester carboxylesterase